MAYLRWQYRMAHNKTPDELEQFHKRVDRLALMMCEELGLDPWQHVTIEEGTEEQTPYEKRHHSFAPMRRNTHFPLDGAPPYEVNDGSVPRVRSVTVSRWNTFRRQAALLIAGHKALTKYLLTEA